MEKRPTHERASSDDPPVDAPYWSHPGNVERAHAMTFCVIVYAELFRALAARSQTLTLWHLGVWTNPHLLLAIAVSGLLQTSVVVFPFSRGVFDVPAHAAPEWVAIALLAMAPVMSIEVGKIIIARLRSGARTHE